MVIALFGLAVCAMILLGVIAAWLLSSRPGEFTKDRP